MAKEISITRPHKLGLDAAMEKARTLVSELATQYGLDTPQWNGNTASVKHGLTGITGQLIVSQADIRVYVDLNLIQRVLQGTIETEINKVLDRALA